MSTENKPRLLTVLDDFLESNDEVTYTYRKLQNLKEEFQPEHLVQWLQQFRIGIEYVHNRFGIIAENIKIAEAIVFRGVERTDTIQYIPDAGVDCIAITEGFLARSCSALARKTPSTNPHIAPLWVSSDDFPILLGVEEAHHSYFLKSGLGKPSYTPGDYSRDPVELAAGIVVREALTYFKIDPISMDTGTF